MRTPIRSALKERRLSIGATQTKIAEMAGIQQGHLSEIESGKRARILEQMDSLLAALGLVVVPEESLSASS